MTLDSDFCKINEEMVKTLQKIKKQKENKTERYLKFFDKMLNSLTKFSAKINYGCKILTSHHFSCLEDFSLAIYQEYNISDLTFKFDKLKHLNITTTNSMKKLLSSLRLYFDEIENLKNEISNIFSFNRSNKKDIIQTNQSLYMKTHFSDEKLKKEINSEDKYLETMKSEKKKSILKNKSTEPAYLNTLQSQQSNLITTTLMSMNKVTKTQEAFYEEPISSPQKTKTSFNTRKDFDISRIFEDQNKISSQNYKLRNSKVDISNLFLNLDSFDSELLQEYINNQTEYLFVQKLAVNEYSVVVLCEKNCKDMVILKIYNSKLADLDLLYTDTLLNISLVHQNIMRTHHFIKNLNLVVMEYINLGALSKFILQNKKNLNEKYCFLLIMQILECINYLHNISKIAYKFLSIDFAPEIKINEILKKKIDYFKCDIYALGIIFHYILLKEFPNKKYVKNINSK